MVCVCGASAGAVKPCPAIAAFFAGIYVAGRKFILYCSVAYAVPNIAQFEFFIAYELMAGVKIAHGVTAMYSVPEPQPDMRLYMHGPPLRSII